MWEKNWVRNVVGFSLSLTLSVASLIVCSNRALSSDSDKGGSKSRFSLLLPVVPAALEIALVAAATGELARGAKSFLPLTLTPPLFSFIPPWVGRKDTRRLDGIRSPTWLNGMVTIGGEQNPNYQGQKKWFTIEIILYGHEYIVEYRVCELEFSTKFASVFCVCHLCWLLKMGCDVWLEVGHVTLHFATFVTYIEKQTFWENGSCKLR